MLEAGALGKLSDPLFPSDLVQLCVNVCERPVLLTYE